MSKDKPVMMRKRGSKDVSVNPAAVKRFMEDGWERCDGKQPEPEKNDGGDSGLTDAEKQMEIDAAGEVARKKAVKKKLSKEDTDAAVEAAKASAAEALEA